jgi:hypothetical protein
MSRLAGWATGGFSIRGLSLLSDDERTQWIKRNVYHPMTYGKRNPTYSGYWPSAVSFR